MTYKELLLSAEQILTEAGVPDPGTDAFRLFEEFMNVSRSKFFMCQQEEIAGTDIDRAALFKEKVMDRAQRVPLQYIIGYQDFYGRPFKVSKDSLIPRFDTEVVVEKAISEARRYCADKLIKPEELAILDVCTGTGCIVVTMTAELTGSKGVGTDISKGAVELAKINAEANNLGESNAFFSGDLFEALKETEFEKVLFDIVVSNPPYIKSSDIQGLDAEVRAYEPMAALDGSEDGLLFYRRICNEINGHIARKGVLVFEIGCDEADDVVNIMTCAGFGDIKVHKDLAGLDRVVTGIYGGRNV